MEHHTIQMADRKRIALISHDALKADLLDWVDYNKDFLAEHELFATGTTGEMIQMKLDLDVTCLQSGPLGGDAQISAMIAQGEIDIVIFFFDPMGVHPHEYDIKALLRIAAVFNVPIACNRSTADFILSSELMWSDYQRIVADYAGEREKDTFSIIDEVN